MSNSKLKVANRAWTAHEKTKLIDQGRFHTLEVGTVVLVMFPNNSGPYRYEVNQLAKPPRTTVRKVGSDGDGMPITNVGFMDYDTQIVLESESDYAEDF
jgi:catalase